jgi:hypothetical protein
MPKVKAPKTIGYQLKPGDFFTVEGCGKSAKGHTVMGGRNVTTGRKMKVKTLTRYRVTPTALVLEVRPAASFSVEELTAFDSVLSGFEQTAGAFVDRLTGGLTSSPVWRPKPYVRKP